MLTLQHFKTMRLIIGVLVVIFGLSVVFHALDAYGHGSSQPQKTVHTVITSQSRSSTNRVSKCKACKKAWRKVTTTTTTTTTSVTTEHYHLAGANNWSLQYRQENNSSTISTGEYWDPCIYVYPNGNKCAG